MFKKFNYNLNHSHIGKLWNTTLAILVAVGFNSILPGETLIDKNQFAIVLLGFSTIITLGVCTYILFKGEIKPIKITYVCPTARQYMNEEEINKIEGE